MHCNLRFGPFDRQLAPQLLGQHPTQAGKEIGAIEQLRLGRVYNVRLAIVIPSRNTPKTPILLEQLVRAQKILEKIGRHIQIVLNNYHIIKANMEGGIQRPAIVSCNLVVALELLLLGQH